jgi:hypothetical protein
MHSNVLVVLERMTSCVHGVLAWVFTCECMILCVCTSMIPCECFCLNFYLFLFNTCAIDLESVL